VAAGPDLVIEGRCLIVISDGVDISKGRRQAAVPMAEQGQVVSQNPFGHLLSRFSRDLGAKPGSVHNANPDEGRNYYLHRRGYEGTGPAI
jgi:hypothetical protein